MQFNSWLKNWSAAADRRRGSRASWSLPRSAESLENRELLSASVLLIGSELNITLVRDEAVRISSIAGNLVVQTGTSGGVLTPTANIATTSSSAIQSIVITGGDEANDIDLSGVLAADFTSLTSIVVDAGNGHDTLTGSPDFADSLFGEDGNDSISGSGGNDTLDGGDGADTIIGGAAVDSIRGGDGADSITSGDGADSIEAGNGSDSVDAGNGDDTVMAGNGEDTVDGGVGNDFLNGDGGADTVNGNTGNDRILGGELADNLLGGDGNDTIDGQSGNDVIDGQDGADSLSGGNGNDRVQGGIGDDIVNGNAGADTLEGGVGSDRILGGNNNDTIFDDNEAGASDPAGADTIQGQSGDDTIFATNGPDNVDGGAGNDLLDNRTTIASVGDARLDPEGDAGMSNMVFTITLSTPITRTVTVDFATSDGTATRTVGGTNPQDNQDYLAVTGTVTFAPGETVKTVNVPILGDTLDESDEETVFLNLTGAVNATIFDNLGDGRIVDDDGAAVTDLDIELLFDDTGSFSFIGPDVQTAFASVITQLQTAFPGVSLGFGVARFEAFDTGNNGDTPFVLNQPIITTTTPQFQAAIDAALIRTAPGFGAGEEPVFEALFQSATGVGLDGNGDGDRTDTGPAGLVSTQTANNTGADIPPFATFLPDPTGPVLLPTVGVANATDGIGFRPGTRHVILLASDSRALIHNDDFLTTYTGAGGVTVPASVFAAGSSTNTFIRVPTAAAGIQQTINALLAENIQVIGLGSTPFGTTPRAELTALALLTGGLNNTPNPIADGAGGNILPGQPLYFEVQRGNPAALANQIVLAVTGSATSMVPPPPPPPPPPVPPSGPQGDTLVGSDGDDIIFSGDFNDIISGGAGNDFIDAGGGNDSVLGGSGNDTLLGGTGDDTLNGQGGTDSLEGGLGDDTFIWDGAAGGNDFFIDGDGDNTLIVNASGSANTLTIGQSVDRLLTVTEAGKSVTAGPTFILAIINGNNGNDTINIGDVSKIPAIVIEVHGGAGNDFIGGTGSPIGRVRLLMDGGDGNDTIRGTLGDDTITGGIGNDNLKGSNGNDTISAGDGDDFVDGEAGNDSIDGGNGADLLRGGVGNDTLLGGNDFDTLEGGNGSDSMDGGDSVDSLLGGAGNDTLLGGLGADTLDAGDGNDVLDGGRNNDSIVGGLGDDKIRGDHGNDTIDAGDGNDTVNGGDGNDVITGNTGNDAIDGGDGDDIVNGMSGNDTIVGGDGKDILKGGSGSDLILGQDGDDTIDGQGGTDTVAGGQGIDVIVDPAAEIDEMFLLSAALRTILDAL